jgi:hypothetical protein
MRGRAVRVGKASLFEGKKFFAKWGTFTVVKALGLSHFTQLLMGSRFNDASASPEYSHF